ncbi:MAG: CdaR family protein [Lachnospiraceae bacterium]|nr:CdaR family protein [Lachnospiraceae bacterium]
MKNKLTRNIGLKLASVVLAVILWLVVNAVNNPTVPQSYYNVPVTLLHTELITESGQVYEVLDGTDMISRVTVRAPRSIISELKDENIIATADVSDISSLDTIAIKLTTDRSSRDISSITGSIDTVKLKIENEKVKSLALKTSTSGQVADGYLIGEVTTDQNLVRITGPESVVDQITKAIVDVSVDGMTGDIVTNAEIRLYNAEDQIISSDRITQNIKSVGVKVSIWQKLSVPVNYSVTGTPAAGYHATGEIVDSGEEVTIAGKASALRSITAINVPGEALDITGLTESLVKEIDLKQYLPDNVFLVDSGTAVRQVTVPIEVEISKRLEIRGERVRLANVPEGYAASISELDESFVIEVIGLSRDVAALQAQNITGTVDVAKWMSETGMDEPHPGFYTVEVDFGLPADVRLREAVTVTLHISEPEEQ